MVLPHGGGAYSGKDPSKVDRSAAYAARHISKHIVANGMAKKCLIQVAYAIGFHQPIALYVDTYNTSKFTNDDILKYIQNEFSLTPL